MSVNKTTIEEEINKVNFIILIAVISTCVIASLVTYWTYKGDRENFFFRESSRINIALEDSFANVSHYLKFVGKSIVESCDKQNLEKIAIFLQDKVPDDVIEKEAISMTMFDWIQPDKMYVANSLYGVFPKKINLDHRGYLEKTDKFPWKAFHSQSVVGVPSAQKIIPVGMGVMDEYGEFYGTIATGVRLDRLEEKIEAVITSEEIIFLLLDQGFNMVVASKHFHRANKRKSNMDEFLMAMKEKINANEDSEGFLQHNVTFGSDLQYKYFKKVTNYPYYLIIGEVSTISRTSLIAKLIPILMAITFIGLCAIAIQVLFKMRVINPLVALSRAKKFDNFSTNIVEIDEIASKLNVFANKLELEKQKLAEFEGIKIALEDKVKERTAALESELKVKTEFLNNVSHEIRTPIQGITAITKGLVDHWLDFDDSKKFKLVKDMFKSSDKLFFLINNLLDISKFSSGKMKFTFEKVDVRKVIKVVVEEFKLYVSDNSNLKITVEVKKDCNTICYADSSRLAQVLRNLLSNAVKFTQEGAIKIIVENMSASNNEGNKNIDYIKISVRDNGVGVPPDEIEQIFESFSQSSRTKTVSIGTGLGLSISREIVQGHDGKIWAENNADHHGVTFSFLIPATARQDYKERPVDKSRTIKILLIDDEEMSHTSLSLLLYGLNFQINACTSGHAALDYLNKYKSGVDLIMLDLIMPDIHGLDILRAIKKDKNLSNIPVLIQSGLAGTSEIADAISLGAVDRIEKPFNKSSLLDKINAIIG